MCGIAGFFDSSVHDGSTLLNAMLDTMYHRGPDSEGSFVCHDQSFAVGMRRLSIIDLQTGDQPIWNEKRDIGIVFNGAIYNYKELIEALSAKGHVFYTRSDTEVIVHLYEEYGAEMLRHMRGMFAFCIFDLRKNTLFLARDHFGQKPLYYTTNGRRFAFASEINALHALPWVGSAIDDDAFLDYVCWNSLPPPQTHYRNIWKLPAGCYARLSTFTGKLEVHRYWHLDQSSFPDLTNEHDAAGRLDEVLSDSVAKHLRADVPSGILLSSGLDSFAILAYAQEALGGTVSTFSVGFNDVNCELEGAATAARQAKSNHYQLELTAHDFADNFDRVCHLLDEPIGDPACFAVLLLCELARNHVKVLLSGEGSDELFAGYEGRYLGAVDTLARSDSLRSLTSMLPKPRSPWEFSRWQRFLARVHSTAGQELVNLRSEGFPGDVRHPRGLSSDQRKLVFERSADISRRIFRDQPDRLGSLLAFDVDWQLPESLLRKADKMSMGASIELRTPFLDVEVAEVARRIPSNLKLPKGGPGKKILRGMLEKRFPARSVPTVKKGFPIPLRSWMTGPLREQIESELFSSRSEVLERLDPRLLRDAWSDFLNGWDGERVFYSLWLYEKWIKGHRAKKMKGAPRPVTATSARASIAAA